MELWEIQKLQLENKEKAEEEAKNFLQSLLNEKLKKSGGISKVELILSAVSLNSFNGILTTNSGQKYFFKTHVQSEEIIHEYYNIKILSEAGYDLIKPLFLSKKSGKQILVYPYIHLRTLFEITRYLELKKEVSSNILAAQNKLDKKIMKIYKKTWKAISAKENKQAPIHQLFFLRFGDRFEKFYTSKFCTVPNFNGTFEKLLKINWTINGEQYGTLNEIIKRAKKELNPNSPTSSVIGHGDAHNGNVMLDPKKNKLLLFDPAFAGRHNPLLDIAKPLFHNTFAEWMYFSNIEKNLNIESRRVGNNIFVTHNFKPSKIGHIFLKSKMKNVVLPTIRKLCSEGYDLDKITSFLKSALFACAFLTTNLLDRKKYGPKTSLLGLCISIQFGSSRSKLSYFVGKL